MIELRPKTAFVAAASFAVSAAFTRTTPVPQTLSQITGTVQTTPQDGPTASSFDPLVRKRTDSEATSNEYKVRKADAKVTYKEEEKAVKTNHKVEKKEVRAKCKEAMSKQGGPAQTPNDEGR